MFFPFLSVDRLIFLLYPDSKLILQWNPYVGQFILSLENQCGKEGINGKTHTSAVLLFVLRLAVTSDDLVWNSVGTPVDIT